MGVRLYPIFDNPIVVDYDDPESVKQERMFALWAHCEFLGLDDQVFYVYSAIQDLGLWIQHEGLLAQLVLWVAALLGKGLWILSQRCTGKWEDRLYRLRYWLRPEFWDMRLIDLHPDLKALDRFWSDGWGKCPVIYELISSDTDYAGECLDKNEIKLWFGAHSYRDERLRLNARQWDMLKGVSWS